MRRGGTWAFGIQLTNHSEEEEKDQDVCNKDRNNRAQQIKKRIRKPPGSAEPHTMSRATDTHAFPYGLRKRAGSALQYQRDKKVVFGKPNDVSLALEESKQN